MSILIKGMEMPSNCFTCPVEREADCDVWKGFVVEKGKRYEHCPLIPVPPHGRLIDVDELLKKVVGKFFITNYFTHICDTIAETPTVIHAENAPLDACFAEETERESAGEA